MAAQAVEIYVLFQATGPEEIIIAHCHEGHMDLPALRAAAKAEAEVRVAAMRERIAGAPLRESASSP
jgi:hypothetical protein